MNTQTDKPGPESRSRALVMLPVGGSYIGLAPGAADPRTGWSLENFITLAQAFEYCVPVFFLEDREQEWKDRIRQDVGAAMFPLQQKNFGNDPQLTVALAERMTVSVANACPLGRMLASGGRPLIMLDGQEDHDTVVAALEKALR